MVAEDFSESPGPAVARWCRADLDAASAVGGRTVAMKLLLRVRTVPAVQRRTQIFVGHHHDGEPVVGSSAYFYM